MTNHDELCEKEPKIIVKWDKFHLSYRVADLLKWCEECPMQMWQHLNEEIARAISQQDKSKLSGSCEGMTVESIRNIILSKWSKMNDSSFATEVAEEIHRKQFRKE